MSALADKIAELTGYDGEVGWDADKPNGQPRRCLDVSRARERFGFEAEVGLDDGLAKTLAWYRENEQTIKSREAARRRK